MVANMPRTATIASLVCTAILVAAPGAAAPASGAPAALKFAGHFRIVNWNAAANDPAWNGPKAAEVIANDIFVRVDAFDANVITLQELREDVYEALILGLRSRTPVWDCHAYYFGSRTDLRVTCVKGPAHNFRARRLDTIKPLGTLPSYPVDMRLKEWWGYTQIDYYGVTITNVHTKGAWVKHHLAQLHKEVKSGIVAGDFNHVQPEVSKTSRHWHQTDVYRLRTYQDVKFDHVLTVERPCDVVSLTLDKFGSNHRMMLTQFKLACPPAPRPGRRDGPGPIR